MTIDAYATGPVAPPTSRSNEPPTHTTEDYRAAAARAAALPAEPLPNAPVSVAPRPEGPRCPAPRDGGANPFSALGETMLSAPDPLRVRVALRDPAINTAVPDDRGGDAAPGSTWSRPTLIADRAGYETASDGSILLENSRNGGAILARMNHADIGWSGNHGGGIDVEAVARANPNGLSDDFVEGYAETRRRIGDANLQAAAMTMASLSVSAAAQYAQRGVVTAVDVRGPHAGRRDLSNNGPFIDVSSSGGAAKGALAEPAGGGTASLATASPRAAAAARSGLHLTGASAAGTGAAAVPRTAVNRSSDAASGAPSTSATPPLSDRPLDIALAEVAAMRPLATRTDGAAVNPKFLPLAAGPAGLLNPASDGVKPGRSTFGLHTPIDYPGPEGPWVGALEFGDGLHTAAALYATEGPDYKGPINIIVGERMKAARVGDYFHALFPDASVVVHTPPSDAKTHEEIETAFRAVKSGGFDTKALGHPFDATRAFGQAVEADPSVLRAFREHQRDSLNALDRADAPTEFRSTMAQRVFNFDRIHDYLATLDPRVVDPDVPKAIVFTRDDPSIRFRNSTPESLRQTVDALKARGLEVVMMGPRIDGFDMDGVIDATGHWQRITDARDQSALYRALEGTGVRVAVGQMSGAMDLIAMSTDVSVVTMGSPFRMGMWEEALGSHAYHVINPGRAYDAGGASEAERRYSPETMTSLETHLDALDLKDRSMETD